jgi:hypothetical protein
VAPETRRQFTITAVVLGICAGLATAVMIATGFITDGPRWAVTLIGIAVAFCAIGSVLCLFLIINASES